MHLPLLLLLFVASGTAALIYEVVFFQLLELVIGSSTVSAGVLLTMFMGGMCLGSLLFPRFVCQKRHPLRVYAYLELAIGASGLLVLFLLPLVGDLYAAWGGYGPAGLLLRAAVAGICLLPPTLAMGATLPAVSRWVEATRVGVSWVGLLYTANILGAVVGCLLAGFYLLRVHDATIATSVAAALNAAVGMLALVVAARTDSWTGSARLEEEDVAFAREPGAYAVYVGIALSGFCALAAQVVWTRQLALSLGATVYTFSIVLAVFLLGSGVGSSVGSLLARNLTRPRLAFGWCQVLSVWAMAWSAYMLNESLPYWPINPELGVDAWRMFHLDLARALWATFPAPVLWGASFPLALAAVSDRKQDSGRLVGGIYAANTAGAIAGALSVSLWLVAWIGSQSTQQTMMKLATLAGLLVLLPPLVGDRTLRFGWMTRAAMAVILAVTVLLPRTVPPLPGLLVAYGRKTATMLSAPPEMVYVGEGLHSSVAVSRFESDQVNYHNAGKVQASSLPQDMRLQRMLGHLTTLVPESPRSVLVIGCGAGVTAGAVSINPRVERLTIAEIEPLVPQVVSKYFSDYNYDVVNNPKTQIVVDDARHYLLTTRDTFDAITSDPLDPWVKGAAALYTKEFFELVKRRLNPGGVVTIFVQLYESSPEAVKSEVGTFFDVFPNGVIFGNEYRGEGYDMVLLAQAQPRPIDLDAMEKRLTEPDFQRVRQSLFEVGFSTATDLVGSYAGRASDLTEWLAGASINHDRDLRLQYLAGLGLNQRSSGPIYSDIVQYRRYPADLFIGSDERLDYLRRLAERFQTASQ